MLHLTVCGIQHEKVHKLYSVFITVSESLRDPLIPLVPFFSFQGILYILKCGPYILSGNCLGLNISKFAHIKSLITACELVHLEDPIFKDAYMYTYICMANIGYVYGKPHIGVA